MTLEEIREMAKRDAEIALQYKSSYSRNPLDDMDDDDDDEDED